MLIESINGCEEEKEEYHDSGAKRKTIIKNGMFFVLFPRKIFKILLYKRINRIEFRIKPRIEIFLL